MTDESAHDYGAKGDDDDCGNDGSASADGYNEIDDGYGSDGDAHRSEHVMHTTVHGSLTWERSTPRSQPTFRTSLRWTSAAAAR